ncbi:hypothetical protein K490DRAFT_70429 [Saccharata proteae CBS 121410]|uniref:Uncharacterized protein n=1 Tax=Saccharata proteae CBS 121410 TaxID=1314787 RepID=A0A9P4HYL1_9PEZI|nr:hypothetical protein K490DRAFT_70429 [Saccharata proteae CBS 121410]
MELRLLAYFLAFVPFALADVSFTSPAAGAPVAGLTITTDWTDDGTSPLISDLKTYELFLCTGGNSPDEIVQVAPIEAAGDFATGNTASAAIAATLGGNLPNAYFLRMISTAANGQQVTSYSSRFTLPSMTGTFPAAIAANIEKYNGAAAGPANQVAAGGVDASYALAYTLQTGLTKYAPMQKVPPTQITMKSPTPQYPTSSIASFYKTYASIPTQVQTVTMTQTFSVSSIENTASAAAMPSDDMAKFLARWKD